MTAAAAEFYVPVRRDVVVTLRDLRDDGRSEMIRRPLYGTMPTPGERNRDWLRDCSELLSLVFAWRAEGDPIELQDLADFVRQVHLWIGGDPKVHLPIVGCDLVLSMTQEPAA